MKTTFLFLLLAACAICSVFQQSVEAVPLVGVQAVAEGEELVLQNSSPSAGGDKEVEGDMKDEASSEEQQHAKKGHGGKGKGHGGKSEHGKHHGKGGKGKEHESGKGKQHGKGKEHGKGKN